MPRRPAAVLSHVLAATLGAAVGEVQTQQALGEGPIGRRLVMRRSVGTDARRDAVGDRIGVRAREERDRRCGGVPGPTQGGTQSTTESWFGPRKNGIA